MIEPPEKPDIDFLICFAVREEAAFALPLPEIDGGAKPLITGMGRRNASTQIQKALTQFNPECVITCGFAGALDSRLKIGDVLFDEDFDAGLAPTLNALKAVNASFHCSTRVAVTAREKSELRHSTGADAV